MAATAATGAGAMPTDAAGADLRTRPAGTQTEPQLEAATSTGVPETGQFLLLCSLQLWQQLQHCRQTRARVPLFLYTFYFRSAETVITTRFLGKQTVRGEHSR